MPDLEGRVSLIEERNVRVTKDKAWEISWTRRGLISSLVYVFGFILLNILGHDGAWKHAFVPVMGYITSTLSLPIVKAAWIQRNFKRKD